MTQYFNPNGTPRELPQPAPTGPLRTWVQMSRVEWQDHLTPDGCLPNNALDRVLYGCLQRIANSLEGIERLAKNLAKQFDPVEAARRKGQEAKATLDARRAAWGVAFRLNDHWRRPGGKVKKYLLPFCETPQEREMVTQYVVLLLDKMLADWPADWPLRDPTAEDVAEAVGRIEGFDPATYDWSCLDLSGLTDLRRDRLKAVILRWAAKDKT